VGGVDYCGVGGGWGVGCDGAEGTGGWHFDGLSWIERRGIGY
jgi:hypothetical protein